MDLTVPDPSTIELAAAYLQLFVTLALSLLCAVLYRRYGKTYFGLWAAAWSVYALRLGAIVTFLHTGSPIWLFWHQVTTGWTALALLWAALVFAQRLRWQAWFGVVVAIPLVWSYLAIYVLDSFLWAAGPAVAFLSLTTAGTAWAFFRYHRLVGSPAARFLFVVLALWALHHLDYPILRAQGAWSPWGYYLDMLFEMGVGLGILFLVLEDLDQGLSTLTALSGELQGRLGTADTTSEAMLRRALSLRGVHGSALWLATGSGGRFVQGAGVAALWPFEGPPDSARRAAVGVRASGVPEVVQDATEQVGAARHAYTAALPVIREEEVVGALVVVGEARDPFTVLDNRFLLAFGQQVGAALANEELHANVRSRTEELERLQQRMVHQHEEERSRLWRELHDETAQVLAALNLQLGVIEERSEVALAPALARAKTLLGEGIKSIRSVTRYLRPIALDDLGLLAAMRALARDFHDEDSLRVIFTAPAVLPGLSSEAEAALYRTMQEALSNTARHARAGAVEVTLTLDEGTVRLTIVDDGPGFPENVRDRLRGGGGLSGIRERITALGGRAVFGNDERGGAMVSVEISAVEAVGVPAIGE